MRGVCFKAGKSSLALFWLCTACLACLQTGCSIFMDNANDVDGSSVALHQANSSLDGKPTANPPARTVRFDGHEIVLGEAEARMIDSDKFLSQLEPLVKQKRTYTATRLILNHREVGQRILWERWATVPATPSIEFIAEVLSRDVKQESGNWTSLLETARIKPAVCKSYQEFRNVFAKDLQTTDPSADRAAQLQQAALAVGHPLVRIDSLRLMGLRELVAGRTSWSESMCRQAIEVAGSSGNALIVADLWLMVAESAKRSEQMTQAADAWSKAIATHLPYDGNERPVDISFWLFADQTRPVGTEWPAEIVTAMLGVCKEVGCSEEQSAESALWTAIAHAQLQRGDMQLALLNFKRAETLVSGNDKLWLRIAQAKCLAGLGQIPAASALLSGPAASPNPAIAASATATMGSTKLQSGAYQQGTQLLHKAIQDGGAISWAGKYQALNDLALAQLIIGDTEPGLEALHGAQAQLAQAGERVLLIQSLQNEMRLLEHEQRLDDIAAIKNQIAQLEN